MDERPIGVFDSGVGGLTVTRALMEKMPKENIVYFGDTARVPYGNKSPETVTRFAKEIIDFLIQQNVKAIVVACNTVSAVSLSELRAAFDIPIFGVVEPGVKQALAATKNKCVGIIGTMATIKSNAYERMICSIDPGIKAYSVACPLFVPLAEEGWTNNEIAKQIAGIYLKPLLEKKIDSLVLGCTHYPLLFDCISQTAGPDVTLVNPAAAAAESVAKFLERRNMLKEEGTGKYRFFVSDANENLDKICLAALGKNFRLEKIDLDI
ncbi:MAG: glutamate racemase [Firmicutes bacterium]|nr:glutamate racemase [Bacillota bacterium]